MKAAVEYDTSEQEAWVPHIAELIGSYGYDVSLVSSEDIIYGELFNGYDFVTFPGGLGAFTGLRKYGDKFGQAIRYYVASGGGFLGICGGAYVAGIGYGTAIREYCSHTLGLVDIETRLDPTMLGFFFDYYTRAQGNPTLIDCRIPATYHPITEGHNGETVQVAFTGGPRIINAGVSVTPLMTFTGYPYAEGELAATASVYGHGRVALCSPHAEWLWEDQIVLEWFYHNMVNWVSQPTEEPEWPLLPWEVKSQITIPWAPIAFGAVIGGSFAITKLASRRS